MLRRSWRLTVALVTLTLPACSAVHRAEGNGASPSTPRHAPAVAEIDANASPPHVESSSDLGYRPREALYFERLSYVPWLRFGKSAQARLAARGIVALPLYGGYATGLSDIYKSDLPVWITADAILHALRWSHAETVGLLEKQVLAPELTKMLDAARSSVRFLKTNAATKAELDVYLTVAASLAHGKNLPCVAGGETQFAWRITSEIVRAEGTTSFALFGRNDVQQLEAYAVRGHYLKEVELQRYYRARKWLSRTALPLVEVRDGVAHVNLDMVSIARILSQLVLRGTSRSYRRMSQVESELVGPPALLGPSDMSTVAVAERGTGGASDETDGPALLDALERATGARPPKPEAGAWVEFALAGRRQVPEDVVLQLYASQPPARVADVNDVPLAEQIGYAVLGHDRALSWSTASEAMTGRLHEARRQINETVAAQEDRSSYWRWVGALRRLGEPVSPSSPGAALAETEDWSRRLLNTQLAGWTLARRDSSLYLEPARVFVSCEFPDAFVDPYPAFWEELRAWIAQIRQTVRRYKLSGDEARRVLRWSQDAEGIVSRLGQIAQRQTTGEPIRAVDLAWINEMVRINPVDCAGTVRTAAGWYTHLFVDPAQAVMPGYSAAPIAEVGREHRGTTAWLHATVGPPHAVVIAVEGSREPRVFVGMVASYQSFLSERPMDDQVWYQEGWAQASVPDWYAPLYESPPVR